MKMNMQLIGAIVVVIVIIALAYWYVNRSSTNTAGTTGPSQIGPNKGSTTVSGGGGSTTIKSGGSRTDYFTIVEKEYSKNKRISDVLSAYR